MNAQHNIKENSVKDEFEQFLKNNAFRFEKEKHKELVRKAFNFAFDAHKGQERYSGEPYIIHPLGVARIAVEQMNLQAKAAAAALLHDIPDKTEYGIDDIRRYFGKKIASIVEGLIRIKNTEYLKNDTDYFKDNAEASTFRQILLFASDDLRVVLIKIADKLHNIRTLNYLSAKKQKKFVNEAESIYAPLSHRIGLYSIKDEFEDLCFKYSKPKFYKRITGELKSSEIDRTNFINQFIKPIEEQLIKKNIDFKIAGRLKTPYSIWKKIKKQTIPVEKVYDIFAVRIIFVPKNNKTENEEAREIGEIIKNFSTEIKHDRTRNWLENPKETGYRALHITIKSTLKKWVEVQIRSQNMHEEAEYGLAAHWKYKGLEEKKSDFDDRIKDILKHLSEDNYSAEDFLDTLKLNLLTTDIHVLTPTGQIITLPIEATALDFAFKIHTDIALRSIAVKVNGETKYLDYKLQNGDRVEIITSQKQEPQKEWFKFVITHRAKNALKLAFRIEQEAFIDIGKKRINNLFEELNIPNILQSKNKLVKELKLKNKKDLYLKTGEGEYKYPYLERKIKKCCPRRKSRFWNIIVPFVKGTSDENVTNIKGVNIAECCNPVPGDGVVGIKRKDNSLIDIHKKDCPLINEDREIYPVQWSSYSSISILSQFIITGRDAKGLINKIISTISNNLSVNINSLDFKTEKDRFRLEVILHVKDKKSQDKTNAIISKIKNINEVETVERIEN